MAIEGVFTDGIYAGLREGAKSSAQAVIPVLLDELRDEPIAAIDVGCGEGHWGQELHERTQCSIVGVDREARAPFPVRELDLATGPPLGSPLVPFDLALCLEVAEHLPPARAESFIAELCALAPVVVFSAAIPGQGGHGHLNEQPPGYWAALFDEQGFEVSGALRWKIWEDDRVENWYRQNLLVCVDDWERAPGLFSDSAGTREPLHVVHPVLFDARRDNG